MDYIEIIILVLSFIVLLAFGVPIAYSIGISGILTLLVSIMPLPALPLLPSEWPPLLTVLLSWPYPSLFLRAS